MIQFLEDFGGFIESIGIFLESFFNSLITAFEILLTSIALPLELSAFMPGIIGISVSIVVSIFVVKFILGR